MDNTCNHYQGNQTEDDMSWTRSSHGRYDKSIRHFSRKTWRKETIDGRIILKFTLKKWDVMILISFGLGWGPVAGSSEHGNEPSDLIKYG